MPISLENYEEYFSCYIDNELSEAEQKELFQFLDSYPHLKQELEDFKLTMLQPEEKISFPDKSFLFKNEPAIPEEQLVAYLDKELNADEEEAIGELLAQNPEAAALLEQLKQAQLIPDNTICFPNKKLLYRYEKKKSAVVWMYVRKYAAAAVLLGFIAWFVYPTPKVSTPIVTEVSSNTAVPNSGHMVVHQPQDEKPTIEKEITFAPQPKVVAQTAVYVPSSPKKEVTSTHTNLQEKLITRPLSPDNQIEQITATTLEPRERLIIDEDQTSKFKFAGNKEINTNQNSSDMENMYAKNELTEDGKNADNYFMNTPANEIKRTKVGGFLKKVKRMIERTNPINQLFDNGNSNDNNQ